MIQLAQKELPLMHHLAVMLEYLEHFARTLMIILIRKR